jgi:hypothetical protein
LIVNYIIFFSTLNKNIKYSENFNPYQCNNP